MFLQRNRKALVNVTRYPNNSDHRGKDVMWGDLREHPGLTNDTVWS